MYLPTYIHMLICLVVLDGTLTGAKQSLKKESSSENQPFNTENYVLGLCMMLTKGTFVSPLTSLTITKVTKNQLHCLQ